MTFIIIVFDCYFTQLQNILSKYVFWPKIIKIIITISIIMTFTIIVFDCYFTQLQNILSKYVFSFIKKKKKNTYNKSFQTRNQKMAQRSPTVTRPHNPPFKGKNRPLHQQNTLNRVPMQTGALYGTLEKIVRAIQEQNAVFTFFKHVTCEYSI